MTGEEVAERLADHLADLGWQVGLVDEDMRGGNGWFFDVQNGRDVFTVLVTREPS